MEFRELHCCSRCALDKIFEIYNGDGGGDAKKEKWRTTKLFLNHVSYTLLGEKKKENFFPTGSREDREWHLKEMCRS